MIIDGKKVAADLRANLKKKVVELQSTYNAVPGLTVILIGEDMTLVIGLTISILIYLILLTTT